MEKIRIESVNEVTPSKGSNAGRKMYVINGEYWSRVEPRRDDVFVCIADVEATGSDGKKHTYTNVVGFEGEERLTKSEKIEMLLSHDASYQQGIAMLLK